MSIRNTAVLLAGGRGRRMESDVPKQYLDLCGRPLLYYSLRTLLESSVITDLVIVCADEDRERIQQEVISPLLADAAKSGRTGEKRQQEMQQKLRGFAGAGAERSGSVLSGLEAVAWPCDYVFIHDGARPFPDEETLIRLSEAVQQEGAVIAAVPSKDTIKIADENGYVASTPDRRYVYNIQTPQVFSYELILKAYQLLREKALQEGPASDWSAASLIRELGITDDAAAAEKMCDQRVKLVESSYRNFKITTPEDMDQAWAIAMELQEKWDASLLQISVE
ncbi:MAG: 2-C-methyl-D-erythritol 4-phosphate cytidylyltransferase [Lachnospiraceae bacterium]|nr:2-C-methyl-D-erythritol 4-phosphate cytidylyltransferase [Lachnospiraceae bacterium]